MAYKFHKKRPLFLNEKDFEVMIEVLETIEDVTFQEVQLLNKVRKIHMNIKKAREFKERDFLASVQKVTRGK